MAELFKGIVTISFYASIFAILVFFIRVIIGKKINKTALTLLWGLFLIRLMLPVQIESPLSIQNIMPVNVTQNISQTELKAHPQTEVLQPLPLAAEPTAQPAPLKPPSVGAAGTPQIDKTPVETKTNAAAAPSLWEWASMLWMAGVVVLVIFFTIANSLFLIKLRKKQRYTEEGFLTMLAQCRQELKIKQSIEVIRMDEIGTAAVCGIFRPKVLICPQAFERLDKEAQKHILLHELMHIKRLDTKISLIMFLLKAVYWFNPIVLFLLSMAQRDMEILCDESVISKLGKDKHMDYAQTLIDLAQYASDRKKMRLIMAVADRPREIKNRIATAIEWKKQKPLYTVIAVLVVLIAVAAGCTSAMTQAKTDIPAPMQVSAQNGETLAAETSSNAGMAEANTQNSKIGEYTLEEKLTANGTDNSIYNAKRALQMLDGYMIKPGETLSLNALLGERTEKNGWKAAPGIVQGELTESLGAGVCDAASLLYAASLYADMEIVERKNHAWPNENIPAGLDATISTGGPDLKIKNNKSAPVTVRTYIKEDGDKAAMTLELYGEPLPDHMTIKVVSKIAKQGDRQVAQVTKEYYQDENLIKSLLFSEDTYQPKPDNMPSSVSANTSAWRTKFADKFTDGEVLKDSSSYKSANINVSVNKVQKDGVTYFLADIYLADIKYFKTAFASGKYDDGSGDHTYKTAAKSNAVIAINGDNSPRNKGPVVRNGDLYPASATMDALVMYNDGTMQTFSPQEFDIEKLKTEGAWQAWTFGPMPLKDGQAMEKFNSGVNPANPRSAIGYFEPGHYCFLVVDGRQEVYSKGLSTQDMSKLFEDLGCKAAFNLDGGQSAEMAFMGQLVNQPYNGGRGINDIVYIADE